MVSMVGTTRTVSSLLVVRRIVMAAMMSPVAAVEDMVNSSNISSLSITIVHHHLTTISMVEMIHHMVNNPHAAHKTATVVVVMTMHKVVEADTVSSSSSINSLSDTPDRHHPTPMVAMMTTLHTGNRSPSISSSHSILVLPHPTPTVETMMILHMANRLSPHSTVLSKETAMVEMTCTLRGVEAPVEELSHTLSHTLSSPRSHTLQLTLPKQTPTSTAQLAQLDLSRTLVGKLIHRNPLILPLVRLTTRCSPKLFPSLSKRQGSTCPTASTIKLKVCWKVSSARRVEEEDSVSRCLSRLCGRQIGQSIEPVQMERLNKLSNVTASCTIYGLLAQPNLNSGQVIVKC